MNAHSRGIDAAAQAVYDLIAIHDPAGGLPRLEQAGELVDLADGTYGMLATCGGAVVRVTVGPARPEEAAAVLGTAGDGEDGEDTAGEDAGVVLVPYALERGGCWHEVETLDGGRWASYCGLRGQPYAGQPGSVSWLASPPSPLCCRAPAGETPCRNCGGGPAAGHQTWCGTAPGKLYAPRGGR